MYKKINDKDDIAELLACCCDFHDACIVSANYESGSFVDENFAMHFAYENGHKLQLVFHSQSVKKTIELVFLGLIDFRLHGYVENHARIILDAFLGFDQDDNICFADSADFNLQEHESNHSVTYAIAKSLKWRVIN